MNKIIRGGENRCQYKKTNNIIKLEKEIRLLHRRLRSIRSNHIHQATNKIVKTKPSRVVMETLNIKGMLKDRKSTRLNSSHANISYAVFCLKKNYTPPASSTHPSHPALQPTLLH